MIIAATVATTMPSAIAGIVPTPRYLIAIAAP